MRQSGYYWAKLRGQWIICQYYKECNWWYMSHSLEKYIDSDFKKIDETQVTRQ